MFLTPLCVNFSCMSCKILLTKYCNLRARHRSLNCLYSYSYHGIIFRITSVTNSCKHFRQRYWSLDGVTLWLITSVKLVISQLFHHFGWLHITMLSHVMMCKMPSENFFHIKSEYEGRVCEAITQHDGQWACNLLQCTVWYSHAKVVYHLWISNSHWLVSMNDQSNKSLLTLAHHKQLFRVSHWLGE